LNISEDISLIIENSNIDTLLTYLYSTSELATIMKNCISLFNFFSAGSIINHLVTTDTRTDNISIEELLKYSA